MDLADTSSPALSIVLVSGPVRVYPHQIVCTGDIFIISKFGNFSRSKLWELFPGADCFEFDVDFEVSPPRVISCYVLRDAFGLCIRPSRNTYRHDSRCII